MIDPIERLTDMFENFPGIGPRQAGRFVQHLLRSSGAARREMAEAITQLGGSVRQCSTCMRFFAGSSTICPICANTDRDMRTLAVVASDADLSALERSGTYRGYYFVLGGTISLATEKTTGIRLPQLLSSLDKRIAGGLSEVILALPANPEGDATALIVRGELSSQAPQLSITMLGRGLSTGSEIEYADPETIKSAFENRR